MEGGHRSDYSMRKHCQNRKHSMKHWRKTLEYKVTILPITGQSGSQYHATSYPLANICMYTEHGSASKVLSELHKPSILTFQLILTSRTVLEVNFKTN